MLIKFIALLIFCSTTAFSLDNGLGLTPQMGWNSWNHFGCKINEALIRKTADLLVQKKLASKGYVYVNLDDCWQISRNQTTKQIIQDKNQFPSGMKNLSDYVHKKGLKFGLYSDAGQKTCQGRPGGLGYQKIDAQTYAKWEVDYLKYDNCYNKNVSGKLRYLAMSKALNQSGRHIFYSMCNWGEQKSWEWAGPIANSWRTTGDISDKWDSFTRLLDLQIGLQNYAGKGAWNDPDMLEVGNGGMTFDQYYAHFALWCILKAPLLIGCSLQTISQQTLTILGNQQLIAINQDSLGKQGYRIKQVNGPSGILQIWGGELSNGKFVVAFLNRASSQTQMQISIQNDLKKSYSKYKIRDAIEHKDVDNKNQDIIKVSVRSHSVAVYVLQFTSQQLQKSNILQQQ